MDNRFLSFLGSKDVEALVKKDELKNKKGPLHFILRNLINTADITSVYIINDFKQIDNFQIREFLLGEFPELDINLFNVHSIVKEYNAMNYSIIHDIIKTVIPENNNDISWYINLTSGTSVISTMLLLFAKSHLNAKFYQTFYDESVRAEKLEEKYIPFNISINRISKIIEKSVSEIDQSKNIIGDSEKLHEALKKAKRAAMFDVSCLILGETGTGKELIAKEIHKYSPRKNKPFFTFNCSVFSEELVRSELFGHKKGSFTSADNDKTGIIEKCNHGILFLDEIGDLSLRVQSQLLRFLQEGRYSPIGGEEKFADVKIIAATHKDLLKLIQEGKFREDLYYRLAIEIIKLPALRERKKDIASLTKYFINKYNQEYLSEKFSKIEYIEKKIDDYTIEELEKYEWNGNIRELQHTLKRAVIWTDDSYISPETVRECIIENASSKQDQPLPDLPLNLKSYLADLEMNIINKALVKTNFHQKKAADLLSMDKTTLNKKINK
ncbi:MAG: sigma-54-dependent Fis family transcriptional regulator [Candidatus Atribacteria bacterium]|nr:sigma-54-dependent Fis family transcriptional regulator [Candidatus Atribacteria bacterium]